MAWLEERALRRALRFRPHRRAGSGIGRRRQRDHAACGSRHAKSFGQHGEERAPPHADGTIEEFKDRAIE